MTAAARHLMLAALFSGLVDIGPVAVGQVVILSGTSSTTIQSISEDGRTVVGNRVGIGYYFWDPPGGFVDLNRPTSGVAPLPLISGDGVSMLARSGDAPTAGQPFVATADGGYTLIPRVFGEPAQTFPTSISRDGTVVCGWDETSAGSVQAGWRWSVASGMQVLPGFNFTLSMSGDGRTIFGGNGAGAHGMWRDGVTTAVPGGLTWVSAVNYDGRVFAGLSGLGMTISSHGQLTAIPSLPGVGPGQFYDMNEDGTVAVGYMTDGTAQNRPVFIWTPATGTQRLGDYFASFGYDLSGYRIFNAHVSAEGRTFALGATPIGSTIAQGVIVTVPAPATAALLAGFLTLRAPRRRHVAPTGNPA